MNHTPEPWVFSFFTKPDGSPILTVQDVADTVSRSSLESDQIELYGVSVERGGENLVVCYTGNGPNSKENARLIALAPRMHSMLVAMEWSGPYGGCACCLGGMATVPQHSPGCELAKLIAEAKGS